MKYEIDFEQLLAEGGVIELAEKLGSNTGRIDFLEENPYGTGIVEAGAEMDKMTRIASQELYMNFWTVFESAYKKAWEKEQNH
jgi:prophage maintenance system killer protein